MPASLLSEKELAFLSALEGADNLWGMEDPFRDMNEEELRAECSALERSLRSRGCAADSRGGLRAAPPYAGWIDVCRKHRRLLIFNSKPMTEEQSRLRFFLADGAVVRYQYRGGAAALDYVGEDLMRSELTALFDTDAEEKDAPFFVTGVSRLRRMGSLSRKHFLLELRSGGCDDGLAVWIADGLRGGSDFRSLLAYERSERGDELIGKLVTVRCPEGWLMITAEGRNADSVCITKLCRTGMLSALDGIFGGGKEVDIV